MNRFKCLIGHHTFTTHKRYVDDMLVVEMDCKHCPKCRTLVIEKSCEKEFIQDFNEIVDHIQYRNSPLRNFTNFILVPVSLGVVLGLILIGIRKLF